MLPSHCAVQATEALDEIREKISLYDEKFKQLGLSITKDNQVNFSSGI